MGPSAVLRFSAQTKEPVNKGGKMKTVIGWLSVMLAVVVTSMSYAATTVTISYIEPSQTVGGQPITNLKEIVIYLKQDTSAEIAHRFPATKASGGGAVSKVIAVADPPVCGKSTITAFATAVSTENLESLRAGPVSTTRDVSTVGDCVKPKFPTNLQIIITP